MATNNQFTRVLVPCRRCTPAVHVHQWAVLHEQRGLALRLNVPSLCGIPLASAAEATTSAAYAIDAFGTCVELDVSAAWSLLHPAAFDVATAPKPLCVARRNSVSLHQLAQRVSHAVALCQAVCAAFPLLEVPAVPQEPPPVIMQPYKADTVPVVGEEPLPQLNLVCSG